MKTRRALNSLSDSFSSLHPHPLPRCVTYRQNFKMCWAMPLCEKSLLLIRARVALAKVAGIDRIPADFLRRRTEIAAEVREISRQPPRLSGLRPFHQHIMQMGKDGVACEADGADLLSLRDVVARFHPNAARL